MHLTSLDEMLKGLTDIPICLISALCGIIVLKKKSLHWPKLFFMISFAALLGTVLHTFVIDKIPFVILWAVLYALLYEVARTFANFLKSTEKGILRREKKAVYIAEGIMYALSVFLCCIGNDFDIYVFTAFAIVLMVDMVVYIIKTPGFAKKTAKLCIMLVAVLTAQVLKDVIPYGVVIAHILIIIALFAFCSFTLKNRFEK